VFSIAWLKNAVHVVVLTFVAGFVGVVSAAGANVLSLATAKAAATAGLIAAAAALQALLAPLISVPSDNPTASIFSAMRTRIGNGAPTAGRHFATSE